MKKRCKLSLSGWAIVLLVCGWTIAAAQDPGPDEIPLPSPAAPAPAPPVATPPAAQAEAPAKPKLMDVNSATLEQLMSLPGFSERLAAKVIAGRPYRSRVDLKTRNIVPKQTFDAILDRIVAKSPKFKAK